MTRKYGEPFMPQPWYRILLNTPRFVYEHFIKMPLKRRAYDRLPEEEKRAQIEEREQKGLEAAMAHNIFKE